MEQNYLAAISLCAILIVSGCSKENTPEEGKISISEITASGEEPQAMQDATRTTLDGYSVTWNAGDAVGCMEASKPASNHKFVLTKGAGTKYGTFVVDPSSEPLTVGTWTVYYPYSTGRYTPGDKYPMVIQTQNDETTKHVERTDWLVSDPVKISSSSVGANFKMRHIFALVEFKIKLKNPATSESYQPVVTQFVLSTQDGSNIFPQYIYADASGQMQFDYTANTTAITRSDKPILTATNTTTSWLLTRQSSLQPLSVTVFFNYGLSTSASVLFTPTSILEPGKKYNIELEMELNEANPNSSILTIVRRS
ncbi:MAG: fimbrillin family protein [Bacteroidales bacterium]